MERGSVTKSQRGNKPTLRGKCESVFSGRQMDNVSKETPVVSVMTLYWKQWWWSETKRTIVFTASHAKAKQTDEEEQNPSQGSGNKQENSRDKSEHPCRFKFCQNPSCRFWHPPVCLNYKSEKGCAYGDECRFRHVEAHVKPNKKSKKGGAKGSVAMLKDSIQFGCVSQDSYPRKSILRES